MSLRILAATDFSVRSQFAVAGAARLTAAADARLDVVHVAPSSPLTWLRGAATTDRVARHRLDDAVAHAVKEGAQAHGHLVTGSPVATLDAVSRRLATDVVVLGTRGSWGLRDHMLGTTAERLIERLRCAALVVRHPPRRSYRTLLACVDTSAAAIEALHRAMALAPEAQVHVLHVYEPPDAALRGAAPDAQAAARLAAERSRAGAALEAALTDAGIDMRRVKLLVKTGPTPRVIERAAARLAPDLIAVGRSTSFTRLFLRSIARHVLRMDVCDVLVGRA